MRLSVRVIVACVLAVLVPGLAAAQHDGGGVAIPTGSVAFISYAASPEQLLPEEAAAFDFCRKQLQLDVRLVTLEAIGKGEAKLDDFPAAWWHYARGAQLPPAALAAPVVEAFKAYLRHGGNLLLSLQACQYVGTLGIDVAPDDIAWQAKADVPPAGLRTVQSHAIFGRLPARFQLCSAGTIEPATYARWVKAEPKRGRVLAYSVINFEEKPEYRSMLEWIAGAGRVVAVGEYGFRFTGPVGAMEDSSRQLAANILAQLLAPATYNVALRPKGRALAFSPIGYMNQIARADVLFVERGTTVEFELSCMPRSEGQGAIQAEFGYVDESRREGEQWRERDTILKKEVLFRAGREIREKGTFSTGVKPGGYKVIVWAGTTQMIPIVYVQDIYVVEPPEPNATVSDRAFVYAIETDEWLVEFEKVSGAIKGLTHKRQPNLNFAANEFNSPITKSKTPALLGDFFVTSRKPRDEWVQEGSVHSTDVRQVQIQGDALVTSYTEPSEKLGGFNNVRCESKVWFNRALGSIDWQMTIRNPTASPIEVGDVYIPLAFNTASAQGLGSYSDVFTKRLVMQADASGASSYVVLQRRSGDPPLLVLVPMAGTPFECLAHDQSANKPEGRKWEGLPYLYAFSKATKDIESWSGWYNGHRSFMLGGAESRTFGVHLFWAASLADVERILYSQGRLLTNVSPGYVVPANMPATLQLRCASGLGKVEGDEETTVTPVGDDGTTYRLSFASTGPHAVRVRHGRGEATYLHFYSLPPLGEIAEARAKFILEKQQFTDAKDARRLAFGMWDAEKNALVTDTRDKALSGGSGVAGIGPPLFVAAKNTVFPDEQEVKALEAYIRDALYGRIQDKQRCLVHAYIGEGESGSTDDPFVYPIVFNLYYAMYRIGADYALTQAPATDYLKLAYRTAMAYFSLQGQPPVQALVGIPGEGTLGLILAALEREGLTEEAGQLRQAIGTKLGVLAQEGYMACGTIADGEFWGTDTAGLSGTYMLGRLGQSRDDLVRTAKVLAATRGIGRHWAMYGCDAAWGAAPTKYKIDDVTTLGAPGAFNSAAMLDAGVLWADTRSAELAYAGLLAPWARLEANGKPHGIYSWEPKLMRYDPYSGDVDAALAPTFFYLGALVVYDSTFGLIGCGCTVTVDETAYTIEPADGMGKRVISVPHHLQFEVGADTIKKVTATMQADRIDVEIARGWAKDHNCRFAASGLTAGSWALSFDGGQPRTVTADQLAGGISIPFAAGRDGVTITLTQQAAAATQ